jgi:hypothetical protein
MRPGSACLLSVLTGALLLGGCSSEPASTRTVLHPEIRLSRDGVLGYRIPSGWFDVTADSQATGRAIWLVRNDYGASITVEQVYLMARAQGELGEAPLLHLAELTLPLVAGTRSATVLRRPELVTIGGRQYCAYELVSGERSEHTRVMLFEAGQRVYAATFYGDGSAEASAGISAVQEPFLRSLRW